MKYNQIESEEVIQSVITNAEICRIGLRDGEGVYITPMYYGVDENKIFLFSHPDAKKNKLIRQNSNITFTIETEAVYHFSDQSLGDDLECVFLQGYGKARILEDPDAKCNGLRTIKKHYLLYDENCTKLTLERLENITIIQIDIERVVCKTFGV